MFSVGAGGGGGMRKGFCTPHRHSKTELGTQLARFVRLNIRFARVKILRRRKPMESALLTKMTLKV